MLIGCPKELKDSENRVGLTPIVVQELVNQGHIALVEEGAGLGSGLDDEEYREAGARLTKREIIFSEAEMIVKVKEPLPEEIDLLHEGQILFAFLHLAADKALTRRLLDKKIIGIAYETVELPDGSLPLLMPMSVIAGRLAPQVGATCLQSNCGGRGILLGGVPGMPSAEVVILGAGNVGLNAAQIAYGMGGRVTVMGIASEARRLENIVNFFGGHVDTRIIDAKNVPLMVERADLLIGAVLVKGAKAPKLVTRDMVKSMKRGSVVVDVSVDQGGCVETTHPTTHTDPTYCVDNVIHYCVTNMPGIVARTSTFALTSATAPYIIEIAKMGCKEALISNSSLRAGLNVYEGRVTNKAVAESLALDYIPFVGNSLALG